MKSKDLSKNSGPVLWTSLIVAIGAQLGVFISSLILGYSIGVEGYAVGFLITWGIVYLLFSLIKSDKHGRE